jgi:oligoribonuclease NrnB/cAMP/cGMP phosphodiesterase (DHH superfamily)
MKKVDAFSKLRIPKPADKILLLTHTDLDGSGPVVLLRKVFKDLTVKHCSNNTMSFDIKNAVCNPEVNEDYDFIFVTDISCNEADAEKINSNSHHDRLILLDHHPTATHLNQYSWACVQVAPFEDSYRMEYYPEGADAHTSATSLVFDYLEYAGYVSEDDYRTERLREIVHIIASYDTWDWHTVFDDREICQTLDKLFDIYGAKRMENKLYDYIWCDFIHPDLITETDQLFLDVEADKVAAYVDSLQKFKTGNLQMNGRYYSIVFCSSSSYLMETFERMEELCPDYDLYCVNYGTGLSIRSRRDDIHVGELMKSVGGGGHAGAGGVKIPVDLLNSVMEQTLGATLFVDKPEDPTKN